MLKHEHISAEEMLNYVEGRLEPNAVARILAHLATGCTACAQEVAAWKRLVGILETDRREAVPEFARQRAFSIFMPAPPAPGLLDRLRAALTHDSRTLALPVGARLDGGHAPPVELLYQADGIHIGLLCVCERDGWSVVGQIVSEHELEAHWKVFISGAAGQKMKAEAEKPEGHHTQERQAAQEALDTQETEVDDLHEFHLNRIPAGTYTFALRSSQREIVLPDVTLPA